MENTVNMNTRIEDIFSYFEEQIDGVSCDIMCIRGINNFIVYYKLITMFKKRYKNIYVAPDYYKDNIDVSHVLKKKDIKKIFENNKMNDLSKKKKKKIKNIIISKHKILNIIYSELDDNIIIDDILGIHSVIGVNILINDKIVSVYNTTLCPDIKYANMVNTYARKEELESLFNEIKKNINYLNDYVSSEENINKYSLSNAHILTGTFNMPTFEYVILLNEMYCVDLMKLSTNESQYRKTSVVNKNIHETYGNVFNKGKRKISPEGSDNQIYLSDFIFLYDCERVLIKKKYEELKLVKKKLYNNYGIFVASAIIRNNFCGSDYLLRPSRELVIVCK